MENKTNENNKEQKNELELKSSSVENKVDENKVDKKNKTKLKEEKKPLWREIVEWVVCIIIAFILAVIIKYFIFTPTLVMQGSMTPTILNGERVFINRMTRFNKDNFKRGDIITFEAPEEKMISNGETKATYIEREGVIDSFFYYVLEVGKKSYIKRIIGLPGDHIQIKGGHVYRNGEMLEEEYLKDTVRTYSEDGIRDFVVPEGYFFAMGDNRENSTDCRHLGCVPFEKIEGKVSFRFWPLNKMGSIDKKDK